jgi:hypothetical protein
LIYERLHSQADTIHFTANKHSKHFFGERSRGAFHRDLGIGRDFEILPNSDKDAFQLCYIQESGSATAKIDRVNRVVDESAHLARGFGGTGNFGAQSRNISFEHSARKNVGSEIAVAALRFAKGDGNVQSERHLYDYLPAIGIQHSAFGQEASTASCQ